MKVKIQTELPIDQTRVGNVYQVRGGYGAKLGHVSVIIGLYEGHEACGSFNRVASCITLNKVGEIVSATSYNTSYFEGKTPIAFVDGLEDLELIMRSL